MRKFFRQARNPRAKVNESSLRKTVGCLAMGLGLFGPVYALHRKMIHVDADYNGREVSLRVGEMLEIALPENRTTGFRWDLKSKAEPACILVKSTFEPAIAPPGRGGTHRWQFQAVHAGTGEIELEYRRPWEQDSPPGRIFSLSIHIQKKAGLPSSRPTE